MQRILIVNVNWLGDVLFSTPAIRAIKKQYPKAYLACMVVPRVKEVLENNPYIDELIIFDEKSTQRGMLAKLRFIFQLRKFKFDTAIILRSSLTRALICFFAGIKELIGYQEKKQGFLLTKSLELADRDSVHRVDYFLNLLSLVGIQNIQEKYYDFVVTADAEKYVADLLQKENIQDKDLLIVAHVGANWGPKRWPAGNFACFLNRAIGELKARVILTGSENDKLIAEEMAKLMQHKPLIWCGKTSLVQLGALMQKAQVLVSADSGPLHLASAVSKAKILALFGPTLPRITGPFLKDTDQLKVIQKEVVCQRPCYVVHCKDNHCMQNITGDEVFEEIRGLVKKI